MRLHLFLCNNFYFKPYITNKFILASIFKTMHFPFLWKFITLTKWSFEHHINYNVLRKVSWVRIFRIYFIQASVRVNYYKIETISHSNHTSIGLFKICIFKKFMVEIVTLIAIHIDWEKNTILSLYYFYLIKINCEYDKYILLPNKYFSY